MPEPVGNAELVAAQNAMGLPEVQDMVKRLAAYNLGDCMPHLHDSEGNMLPLPDGIVQVEDDLQVSFQPRNQVRDSPEIRYLPVGWRWSEERQRLSPDSVCRIVRQPDGSYKHVSSGSFH